MSERAPNVLSIAPGVPFLETLADELMGGGLVPGYAPGRDPFALADAVIFVPTRRSARALAATFVAKLDRDAALLPDIRPLGTTDLDEIRMDEAARGMDPGLGAASLTPAIDPATRHVLLTRLVQTWWHSLREPLRDLYAADITVPSSLADAAWFARDLARLMDSVVTEEAGWENLARIDPQDTGQWWQLTLQFLQIATDAWPDILAERGVMDPVARHAHLVDAQLEALANDASGRPVVAAGSTGSIPSTARLLAHVARRPGGAVVLPGLYDLDDDAAWNALLSGGSNEAHPQYGLARLLDAVKVGKNDVSRRGAPPAPIADRNRIVAEALRPADETHSWSQLTFNEFERDDAFAGVTYVEAANEREEATAIAYALREALEDPQTKVALVTPDRNLARRVAIELERFGVDIDDSAGRPLRNTTWGRFASLVLRLGGGDYCVEDVAALVKHPLLRLSRSRAEVEVGARAYELLALRGALVPPRVGELAAHLEDCLERREGRRIHPAAKRLEESDIEAARGLAAALDEALGPLTFYLEEPAVSFATLTDETVRALEALATPEGDEGIWSDDDGEEMSAFLGSLLDVADDLDVAPAEWPAVLDAFMADRAVRARDRTHPRAVIWGPLEARLMHVDRIVLGGLNEETWPAALRNDAFLSRPMKASLPLEPPERRIGQAAHDLTMLFGHGDLVLTRSLRQGTRPTVASRWWQRIATLAGPVATDAMGERGRRLLALVRADGTSAEFHPCARPEPMPPAHVRPSTISITEVERYVRDPYAVYARRILALDPLPDLVRVPDVAERGTLFHAIMERWTREGHDAAAPDATAHLARIADDAFEAARIPPEVAVLWRPRFDEVARDFLQWEAARAADVDTPHVEVSGAIEVGGVKLVGRADRIDRLRDGSLAIVDYKTGGSPSKKQANTLLAPQLPLTAALAARGGFRGVDAADTSYLAYVRLRPGKFADETLEGVKAKGGDAPGPAELGAKAWAQLEALVARFSNEETPYLSLARPMLNQSYEDPYAHLARVGEWRLADDGEGESE